MQQAQSIEDCEKKRAWKCLSTMSNFEETIDDIEKRFLANPENVSFLVGVTIELGILIENTNNVIDYRRQNDLKKSKTTIW